MKLTDCPSRASHSAPMALLHHITARLFFFKRPSPASFKLPNRSAMAFQLLLLAGCRLEFSNYEDYHKCIVTTRIMPGCFYLHHWRFRIATLEWRWEEEWGGMVSALRLWEQEEAGTPRARWASQCLHWLAFPLVQYLMKEYSLSNPCLRLLTDEVFHYESLKFSNFSPKTAYNTRTLYYATQRTED